MALTLALEASVEGVSAVWVKEGVGVQEGVSVDVNGGLGWG